MSESLEIVEITDTSIITDASLDLKDSSALQNTTKTKRQLDDELNLEENAPKKTKLEESVETLEIDESAINDTIVVNESKEPNELNLNLDAAADELNLDESAKSEDLLIESVGEFMEATTLMNETGDEFMEEIDESKSESHKRLENETRDDDDEEELEESFVDNEEEAEEEEDDDYDDSDLMARANLASTVKRSIPSNYQEDDDGTIALDDSDDEPTLEKSDYPNESDSSEYSVNNDDIAESDDSDEGRQELEALQKRQSVKPQVRLARKLVKKSFRFLSLRKLEGKREPKPSKPEAKALDSKVSEAKPDDSSTSTLPVPSILANDEAPPAVELKAASVEQRKDEAMDVTEETEPAETELPLQKSPELTESKKLTMNVENDKVPENGTEKKEIPMTESDKGDKTLEKPYDNSSESSRHESSLLTEVANSTTEEIFNRYVVKTVDNSPTLDEFSEELFYCLQLNNIEIEKAKQLWNEKLHIKYKIRELMETIRRHRAVMEIEAFGFKPDGSNQKVVSSKSSTTNSETDNYEKHSRMSSESVSRLIQDVRATMLKRDDKLRTDEAASGSNAGEGSLAAQWNSLQSNTGRQGQIVDVQSIINDFRQKNPQEIPRRGRRMKNTFDNNFFENQQEDSRSMRKDFMANVSNNSNDSSMKANAGYPEVSLHPVQNIYKNLANQSGGSALGIQRSSLLQSILTKQSTKSPSGFIPNQQPSTSTLARLLTAPERSFQGAPKHPPPRQTSTKSHNNGEITITPISLNSSRSKDYSMDDDENSLEPPLVIDEAEDFDSSERGNAKSVSDLLCQGCKKNKAFFMCAGCSRQWYCSKECQEVAWDDHAESCMI